MIFIRFLGLVLTCWLLTACATETTIVPIQQICHAYTVYIEDSFPLKRQEYIKNAGDKWANQAIDLRLEWKVAPFDVLKSVQYHSGTITVFNQKPSDDSLQGQTIWSSDWSYVLLPNDALKSGHDFRMTALHEFGHAFHLNHNHGQSYSNDVMQNGDSITCEDLDQFCSLWLCKDFLFCQPN